MCISLLDYKATMSTENKNDEGADTMSRNKMSEDVITQMQELVSNHLSALKKEDQKVQEAISKSNNSADILNEAKDIAFDNAVSLFGPLQTLKELSDFLQDIIKIENNFNDLYKTMKASQESARQKYAQNIQKYENSKVKIQNEGVDSFEKLIFRALIHVSTFNQLLNKIEAKCLSNNIKLYNSGDVATYFTFTCYDIDHKS